MQQASTGFSHFWIRRLHSLTGILLAFAYVIIFLVPYSFAFKGALTFNLFMGLVYSLPLVNWMEFIFVAIPFFFHAILGLTIIYESQVNVVAYGFYKNWMYVLRRFVGALLIVFVFYHIYSTRLAIGLAHKHADFEHMSKLLASGFSKWIYYIGVICAAIYIGNGFSATLKRFGITASKRSRDIFEIISWCLAFILAAWGIAIVWVF